MKTFPMFLLVAALGLVGCKPPAPPEPPSPPETAPPKPPAPPAVQRVRETPVQNVDAEAAAGLAAESDVVVLDVRTAEEYAEGHIAGAICVDVKQPDFAEKVAAAIDKGDRILVHCRSGNRSMRALEMLVPLGYTSIYHLDGGIVAYEEAGYPVEK